MSLDKTIFKEKSLSDLFGEIYDNSKKKDKQINALIGELKPLIADIGDATLVVPMIKEYLEIAVKNDDHLVKLAAIVQRLETSTSKGSEEDLFNPEELQALLEDIEGTDQKLEETQTNKSPDDEDNGL